MNHTLPDLLEMTSVADGRTHEITSAEFERGVMAGTGQYRAVCGVDVVVTSMAARPGPWCPCCAEHRRECARSAVPSRLVGRLARRVRSARGGQGGAGQAL